MFESNCKKKKSSILWVIFNKKSSISLGHIEKGSVLWVIKKVQLLESFWKKIEFLKSYEKKFNSMIFIQKINFLSHIQRAISLSPIKEGVQFWECNYEKKKKNGFNSQSHSKKGLKFFEQRSKKRFIFLSHIWKQQFLVSHFWKTFESYPKNINS